MNRFKYLLAITALCLVAPVNASDTPIEKTEHEKDMTMLLKYRLGGVEVEAPVETPAEGVYQTRFGNKFAYLTGNGRYVFIGDMIDLKDQVNLTELSRRAVASDAIRLFDKNNMAIYPAKDETKAVLNVFTDTSCPYCKKLHEEVPELQKAGIEVRYIPFPRGGARGPGYVTLKQVWCGDDRANTMDIAKEVEDGELPPSDCADSSIVDKGYELGNALGVTGTPALFTESGQKFDGYVPHQQLIPALLGGS